MSGQQEQWEGPEQSGQPDPLDATLMMAEPSARGQDRANGHARPIGTWAAAHGETTGRHRSARSLFDPVPAAEAIAESGTETGAAEPGPAAPTAPQVAVASSPAAGSMAAAAPEAASDPLSGTAAEQAAVAAGARARTPSAGDSPARQIDQPNRTPVPGSWADLSQRLERLPYGHPSSPYHVDGERKPPPPRLKHLELAPPVADRPGELPAGPGLYDPDPGPDPTEPGALAEQLSPQDRDGPAAAGAAPGGPASASQDHRAAEPSPGNPASEAEPYRQPTNPSHPYTQPSAGDNKHQSRPAPTFTPANARPAPDAARPVTADSAADAFWSPPAGRPGPAESAADPAQRDSASEPGHSFPASDAERHERAVARPGNGASFRPAEPRRSTTAQARSLPSGRGPGFNPSATRPRTAADGSWTWGPARLTPDQVRIAEDGYERFRTAEGRDLFGSYGGSGLTAKLRQLEGRLEHGRLAPGTEERALLEPDVFRARFADMLRRHPDRSPELLASRVPGALSYAFIFGLDHYADGILLVQDSLEAQGFELQARRNSWNSVANRCVFTKWHDPLSELPFEVQFHTSASLEAQQLARTSAPLINDPRIPPEEAASLRADLASAWAALPSPPGNAEISDYRRYGSGAPRR